MWSSQLFWKVFLACVGPFFLSALFFGVLVTNNQEAQFEALRQQQMRNAAIFLQSDLDDSISEDSRSELQKRVYQLGQQTGLRLTIVLPSGEVLVESEKETIPEVLKMESHANRPEFRQAKNSGEGIATRMSSTQREEYCYYALRVGSGSEPTGYVRVSLPMEDVRSQVSRVRGIVWSFTGLVCVGAVLLNYYFVHRILSPVTELTKAAEAITAGDYQQHLAINNRDEVGRLARSFNRMSVELVSRITELRERGEQMAAVLGGMVEAVVAVDNHVRIMFANDAAGQLFGFASDESRGRMLLSTIRDETLYEAAQAAIKTGNVIKTEIDIFGANRITVAVHAGPLPGDPCPGVVIVMDDMTELRRLESVRQEFVANVSHELKTPLSSIKAYAETLRSGAIHDQDNNVLFVERIEEQANRLQQLIMDMLSLAKIESGQQAFETAEVLIDVAVENSLAYHANAAEAKSIRLSQAPPPKPLAVLADDEAVRQMLDNLIDNAIKYSPVAGEVTVRWYASGSYAKIEVSDTGIGIAKEDQDRLFERFFRVDKARSRELGGTGLGLSIVKHLSQFFGGSVSVESQLGKGSTFRISLPLADELPNLTSERRRGEPK